MTGCRGLRDTRDVVRRPLEEREGPWRSLAGSAQDLPGSISPPTESRGAKTQREHEIDCQEFWPDAGTSPLSRCADVEMRCSSLRELLAGVKF